MCFFLPKLRHNAFQHSLRPSTNDMCPPSIMNKSHKKRPRHPPCSPLPHIFIIALSFPPASPFRSVQSLTCLYLPPPLPLNLLVLIPSPSSFLIQPLQSSLSFSFLSRPPPPFLLLIQKPTKKEPSPPLHPQLPPQHLSKWPTRPSHPTTI